MNLIKQDYKILDQEFPVQKLDMDHHMHVQFLIKKLFQHIEYCGRTCYKSQDKITEDSSKQFVENLVKSKHYSVLEHGAVYLLTDQLEVRNRYKDNPYSRVTFHPKGFAISTTYRVIIENHWENDLLYMCCPTDRHIRRRTVQMTTCIHVYKDLTRHRKMSFSIESTRYCNYTKYKFGNEITFITPCWKVDTNKFYQFLTNVEDTYFYLINDCGWQPQQAAEVLPQCTRADVIISGFEDDWKFVFDLRTDTAKTGQPHPLVKEIMCPIRDEFVNRGYIK